jgi:hypothetical protein
MLATLTAIAPQAPTPRLKAVLAGVAKVSLLMECSIEHMNSVLSQIGPLLLAALVVYGVYRRFRRSFGQQLLRPVRMWVRIATLLLVACLLLPAALRSAALMTATLAGVVGGAGLALWGAARTQFVWVENRLHYVPHTYTGIVVSLLFLGRLAYRIFQMYGSGHVPVGAAADSAMTPGAMVSSPLTLGLFFVLAGYYVCYYFAVLSKSKRLPAQDPAPTSPEIGKAGTGA